ncbi:Squamosa promoter-binding-like protein 9 [Ananas comosus]|uniref:Squamosa promoter-binding-like protein 9 n=1 Tax=Ananas comosus TaxID=4615 RepID=A0A199VPM7_ANACO|nr:Squamosa promoter-binding-like protein 9 [Ananas comosus]
MLIRTWRRRNCCLHPRDPRLVCPNYLAGGSVLVPELDEQEVEEEEEEDVAEVVAEHGSECEPVGRRGGGAAVPGCEADIRELKGPSAAQVCLRCANASSVLLDGEHSVIANSVANFDEGKRSCRRKLEKHNKRRRRRPDSRSIAEKEIEAQDTLVDVTLEDAQKKESPNGFACETVETMVSNNILERETPMGSEDGHGSISSLPGPQNDQGNSVVSFAASVDASVDGKVDNTKPSLSATFYENKTAYSSMCPTGRISFKLYDWNPAEFPRRLRHQIFEWLAGMPVELEGYIRPGCTILTVFIAMPQFMWEKLAHDAAPLVRDLVNAPNSLLFGRGTFLIYLSNMIVQILKDGTSLMNIRMEVEAPRLHYVHPAYFEVGKPIEFVVCGSFLDQPKFRFLVSFNGKYLKNSCCRLTSHVKNRPYNVHGGDYVHDSEHEVFRISINQAEAEEYGPAFIEVENVSGISNFVPVLFGNKHICSELKRFEETFSNFLHGYNLSGNPITGATTNSCEFLESKQNAMSALLLDIAWLLKKPQLDENKSFLSSANIQRLTYLLRFLIDNEFFNVLEIIMQSLEKRTNWEAFSNLKNQRNNVDVGLFLEYVKHAQESIGNRAHHDARLEEDSRNLINGIAMPLSYFESNANSSIPFTSQKEGAIGGDEQCAPTTTSQEDETVALLTKDVAHRQCCSPQLSAKWRHRPWTLTLSSNVMKRHVAMVVMVSVVMCLTTCIVLLHPHKAAKFAVSIRRCLFGGSFRN